MRAAVMYGAGDVRSEIGHRLGHEFIGPVGPRAACCSRERVARTRDLDGAG